MKIHPNTPNYIGIEFKVWAPKLTRVTKRLFLLGSLKELGAWNIDKALKAFPTPDMHIWTVEASIPAMCHFEWVWLTTNLNRAQVEWEKSTKRNRTVDCFSGTLHTVWGELDEVFLQSAASLEVTTFVRVEEGHTLVLTGSTPSTGEWNLHYAKPATEFPKKSGYWKINVAFDALTNLEFKWAVVKEKDHDVLRVQEKLPHSIFGRKSWIRAVAPWMTPVVVVVDMSLLCDMIDTKQSRTDIIVQDRKKRAEEIKAWLLKAEVEKSTSLNSRYDQRSQPNPVEMPSSLANLSQHDTTGGRSGIPFSPTPNLSNTSMIISRRSPSLEEYIKSREEFTNPEKLTQQLYKKFNEETEVHAIKGNGQNVLPTDRMNIGDSPVDAIEELSMAYGEVAEITSKHLFSCPNPVRQKTNYHFLGTFESPVNEMLEKQCCESVLTKQFKSGDIPATQERDYLKGVMFSDNDTNKEESQAIEVVKSQTVPDTEPSDTGFTEMPSWMSSGKIDVTGSESVLTSSQTMTCVLAGDANNVSDGDESHSDHLTLQTNRRPDNQSENKTSFWESWQTDLTPSWLGKARFNIQDGGCELLAENIYANQDDYEHFDWLVSRLEDNYPIANIDTEAEMNPDCSLAGDKFYNLSAEAKPELDFQTEHTRWMSPSPPKPLQMNLTTFKSSRVCEKDENLTENDAEVSLSGGFDSLYENDLTPYTDISTDSENEEIVERRRTARCLEEHWGSKCQSLESEPMKIEPTTQLPPWNIGNDQSSVISAIADGIKDLISSERKVYKVACYSCSELPDVLLPEAEIINHRERAREIEKMWGDSHVNNSWMMGKAEEKSNVFNREKLVCKSVFSV